MKEESPSEAKKFRNGLTQEQLDALNEKREEHLANLKNKGRQPSKVVAEVVTGETRRDAIDELIQILGLHLSTRDRMMWESGGGSPSTAVHGRTTAGTGKRQVMGNTTASSRRPVRS